MTRRPGLSMTEVLVTLFILALGATAILTLMPVGALSVSQALKDDRTSQCASQADAYMRWYWKTYVVESNTDPELSGNNSAFDNPFKVAGGGSVNPGEPSFPVVVDPMGYYARLGTPATRDWLGGTSLPRRNLNQLTSNLLALRTCSLLDGFGFVPSGNGQPTNPTTGTVDREFRYNWLWVLQRPVNANAKLANMTVVVFDKRAHLYVPPLAEYTYNGITLTPGQTIVTVPLVNGVNLQKGNWIVDTTVSGSFRQAYFYRIVSATANGANLDLELQTPIRRIDGKNTAADAYSGTLVVISGVSEVFERPSLLSTEN